MTLVCNAAEEDAEIGQRSFVLTGDDQFLEAFLRGSNGLTNDLDCLASLVADNPEQVAPIAETRPLVAKRIALAQKTIDMRHTGSFEDARAEVVQGRWSRRDAGVEGPVSAHAAKRSGTARGPNSFGARNDICSFGRPTRAVFGDRRCASRLPCLRSRQDRALAFLIPPLADQSSPQSPQRSYLVRALRLRTRPSVSADRSGSIFGVSLPMECLRIEWVTDR
jgi:CHASE3 domain-containing protein